MNQTPRGLGLLIGIVLALVAGGGAWLRESNPVGPGTPARAQSADQAPATPSARPESSDGYAALARETARTVAEAFAAKQSNLIFEGAGIVDRELPDDTKGDKHQRFILRLADDATLLISHNIDLAPRVPLKPGDRVWFKGEYEWSKPGGVVHWTHRNPARNPRHPHGWLRHNGRTYE